MRTYTASVKINERLASLKRQNAHRQHSARRHHTPWARQYSAGSSFAERVRGQYERGQYERGQYERDRYERGIGHA